jgi:hypothetical protein
LFEIFPFIFPLQALLFDGEVPNFRILLLQPLTSEFILLKDV